MRKYCLTGLVILLPLVLTFVIFIWLIDIFTEPFMPLAKAFFLHKVKDPFLLVLASRLLALGVLLILLFLTGFLATRYFMAKMLSQFHKLMTKVPGLRIIYSFCREIIQSLLNTKTSPFKGSVLIPFPQADTLALGLVTENIPLSIQAKDLGIEVSVFVPTAPHPISGFMLMTPKKYTYPIDMSTEEVFKFIISCGTIPPEKESP